MPSSHHSSATRNTSTFEQLYIDQLARLPHVQTLTSQLAMESVKRTNTLPIRG